jgi:IS5 family transposase
MKHFKRHRDYGFWDQDFRLTKISKLGDPLERLKEGVNFELFGELLEDRLSRFSKGAGGRPPYSYMLMFKILILQRYYNLSDEQVEFQINDRLSFMRFLDLTIADDIPDSRTVWHFREQLTALELVEELFDLFLGELNKLGLLVNEGEIIDASFVEVPRQRNKKEENEQIKEGKGASLWSDKPKKKQQKDIDARWAKKNSQTYYGYKNHVKQDDCSKLITKYIVSSAKVHDSQATDLLLDEHDKGDPFYADSAYTGEPQEQIIESKGMKNRVCERGYRNHPLTEGQKASNTEKSRFRSRVGHIFGFMEMSMNEMYIHSIGIKRATAIIGLMDLTYNMFRKIQLQEVRVG